MTMKIQRVPKGQKSVDVHPEAVATLWESSGNLSAARSAAPEALEAAIESGLADGATSFSVGKDAKLSRAPQNLGRLEELRKVVIWNKKTVLGDALSACPNLEEIELLEVPDSPLDGIGRLKKLQRLRLYATKLTAVPDDLAGCEALEELLIETATKLVTLPASVGSLRRLRKILIDRAPKLRALPEDLGALPALEELSILEAGLRSLPDSIVQLRTLRVLSIGECRRLEEAPAGIFDMKVADLDLDRYDTPAFGS